jgi:hypothetical protein
MSTELTVKELSKSVPQLRKNKGLLMAMEELQEMYSSRVLMADFLACKGIPTRAKAHPDAKLDGGHFSKLYRKLAAEQEVRTAFVRSATDNLLWDIQFLDDNLAAVKERIVADIKVELFGTSD